MCIRDRYYAESIDTNIVVNQGESKFPIPHLKGYEVSVSYTHLDVYKRQV